MGGAEEAGLEPCVRCTGGQESFPFPGGNLSGRGENSLPRTRTWGANELDTFSAPTIYFILLLESQPGVSQALC